MATHSSILAWRIPWAENPMGREAWRATLYTIKKNQTQLSDSTTTTKSRRMFNNHKIVGLLNLFLTFVAIAQCFQLSKLQALRLRWKLLL